MGPLFRDSGGVPVGGIFFRCEFLRGMNFFASQRRCFFADQRRCFFSRATNVGAFLCEKRIGCCVKNGLEWDPYLGTPEVGPMLGGTPDLGPVG